MFWVFLSSLAVAAMYIAAFLCALQAASTARTPQGAVGWVVFLLATPFLAIPAYLFLGHHRISGYQVSRRESKRVIDGIRDFATTHAPDPEVSPVPFGPFEHCADMPVLRGNAMDLLINGEQTFDAIFDAIDDAKSYVLVQFYIIHDDTIGRALRDRLIAAAKRGLTVRLLTDGVGSYSLPASYLDTLRAGGVTVADPGAAPGPRHRFQINYRNHRKTVVIDGNSGFTGGLNVGDEYTGNDPTFGPWRDTHIRLTGPMVLQLQLIFAEDWHWATGEFLLDDLSWRTDRAAEDMPGLIVATGPSDLSETGSLMFFSAIASARNRLWIASPYFVPDTDIVTALRHAALRGVDVRLMVPDMADHHLPWLAAHAYFDAVRSDGVRIFRYIEGFMHQKVFVVDDDLAAVGTSNLDNRSFRLNFETMALFFDSRAAAQVDAMLREDFTRCFELTEDLSQQSPYVRWGAPVARLFAPLL
ncbi:cardiolipin synthase [Seohaeicola saemankumensis]|nr:cardiolipin synthase [Seohaeicola saemankumensis]MCA0873320.1 cardiolipin synthase [Seohaeicola saemankumensis]